jgi:hypothetical protein
MLYIKIYVVVYIYIYYLFIYLSVSRHICQFLFIFYIWMIQDGPRKSSPGPYQSVNTEISRVARDTCKTEGGLLFRGPLCMCKCRFRFHMIR